MKRVKIISHQASRHVQIRLTALIFICRVPGVFSEANFGLFELLIKAP